MSGTAPKDAPQQDRDGGQPADGPTPEQPGFGSRGKARRRARFLRRARELAYRDLGGLVYNLHRFGQRNDALVLGKLATLGHIDTELRTIETALGERRPVTVLREAGITACPRCAAIHGSEDRFCPNCGLPMARNVDLPVAGAPTAAAEPAGPAQPPAPGAPPAGSTPPASAQPQAAPQAPPTIQPQVPAGAAQSGVEPHTPAPAAQSGMEPHSPAPAAQSGMEPHAPATAPQTSLQPQSPALLREEESTEILHPQRPGQ